jgi:hypothetical protein
MVARVPTTRKRASSLFQPGHKTNVGKKNAIGNRSGPARLERRFVTALMKSELQRPSAGYVNRAHKMVDVQIRKAEQGDTPAFNGIVDRVEGRPTQTMEHSGKSGGPIPIVNVNMPLADMMKAYQQTCQEDDE